MATFGRTTENASTLAGVASQINGTRFTLGTAMTASKVSVRLSNTGTGHEAAAGRAAIYSSDDGEPDALLAESGIVAIADALAVQWVDFDLSSPVALDPAQYFLAIWTNADSTGVQLRYLNLTGRTYFAAHASSAAAPDPFGADPSDFYAIELNIYASSVDLAALTPMRGVW